METKEKNVATPYDLDGKPPLKLAIPLGLQHVLAMFVGNLTPLLIITGVCGIESGSSIQVALLQNAMLVAGIVTLIQVYTIGPIGGKLPIVMGTSSGFIGVCRSVAITMGSGVAGYGAVLAACFIGGLFETVLGGFLKPLRKFFPAVVTGTVVLSIGLSLISVGIGSFGGGSSAADYGSLENLFVGTFVLVVIIALKHGTKGFTSFSSILIGIIAGYILVSIMAMILPTTFTYVDETGATVEATKAWVVNWSKVADASWFAVPKIMPVKWVFDAKAIVPICIMFVVTAVETVGDISGITEGGLGREATDKELSGGVMCDGLGSSFAALLGVLPNTSFSQNVGLVAMNKSRKPLQHWNRWNLPDRMRTVSETCSTDLYHAAERSGRSCCHDVFLHRSQRNPAYYQMAYITEKCNDRFGCAWRWIRARFQLRSSCTASGEHQPDLRRLRYCSGSVIRNHPEYRSSEG